MCIKILYYCTAPERCTIYPRHVLHLLYINIEYTTNIILSFINIEYMTTIKILQNMHKDIPVGGV